MDMLKDRNSPEDVARLENLEELTRAVAESMEAGEEFTDFLDAAALVSDADSFEGKPGVTLITLHSTKGLEFDHVFLTGMEEGICPHGRSLNEEKGIEEERRLVYVGMTRARTSLTLTRAVYRRIFGNEQQLRASLPSRFLAEIPSELVETVRGSMAEIGEKRRYEPDPEYSYSADEFLRRVRGKPEPTVAVAQACPSHKLVWQARCKTRRQRGSHAWPEGSPPKLRRRHRRRRGRRRRRPPRLGKFSRPRHKKIHRALRPARAGLRLIRSSPADGATLVA